MKSRATGTIFVDVDGTLLIWPTNPGSPQPGEIPRVNQALVDALNSWIKKGGDRVLVIWTMGGRSHAEMASKLCGLDYAICLAKPEFMIDDANPTLFDKKHRVTLPDQFIIDTKC